MKFRIEYTETSRREIWVQAKDEDAARDAWHSGDYDGLLDSSVEVDSGIDPDIFVEPADCVQP